MENVRTVRPTWDQWALAVAEAVATRADCTRRKVGAVILDTEHRIVSTGYNGADPGGPSCLAGECPRGRHYLAPKRHDPLGLAMCNCGHTWPCPQAVDPGSSYDTGPGMCISVHAELNAILFADRSRLTNATLYCTEEPCLGCSKLIRSTPIKWVVWPEGNYING